MGAVTVWATYALAVLVFPGRPELAVAAAAFIAFLPEFLFISGSVNNDNLAAMLSGLTLLQMARLWRGESRPGAGDAVARRTGADGQAVDCLAYWASFLASDSGPS